MSVLAGRGPLVGRQLWHRKTVRTGHEAQIALGRLLEQAADGRRPTHGSRSPRQSPCAAQILDQQVDLLILVK